MLLDWSSQLPPRRCQGGWSNLDSTNQEANSCWGGMMGLDSGKALLLSWLVNFLFRYNDDWAITWAGSFQYCFPEFGISMSRYLLVSYG